MQSGMELSLLKLLKHFNNSDKYQAKVVLPNNQGIAQKCIELGIPLKIIKFKKLRKTKSLLYHFRYLFLIIPSIFRIFWMIRKEHIDLIHVNEIIDFHGLIAGKIANVPTISHVRFIVENSLIKKIFLWILNHFADRIVCVSEAVKKGMFEGERVDHNKINVIYDPGPYLNLFDPSKYLDSVSRSEFNIDNQTFLIGFVSKIVEINGQINLVEVANRLNKKGFQDIRYMFVGGTVDGHESYYKEIKSLISSYKLEEKFIWTGFREDIPQIMKSCDILVFLPICEHSFPGVVLEAMAMEKPLITFDSGGICEQIVDGESGYIIPKGDIDKVVERIIELYHNPNKRIEIGKNARRHLLSKFSLERHVEEINQLYDELLEGNKI
jgi:glycosyltransferase involved in cell wall biosynthesis